MLLSLLCFYFNFSLQLFMWRSGSPNLKRCHFAMRRQVLVKDAAVHMGGLLLITDQGEAFLGYSSGKKLQNVQKDSGKETKKGEFCLCDNRVIKASVVQ
jgi:hypothetical protein